MVVVGMLANPSDPFYSHPPCFDLPLFFSLVFVTLTSTYAVSGARRSMAVYAEAALSFQGGYGGAVALPAPHMEGMRMSAVSRLQVCAADADADGTSLLLVCVGIFCS